MDWELPSLGIRMYMASLYTMDVELVLPGISTPQWGQFHQAQVVGVRR